MKEILDEIRQDVKEIKHIVLEVDKKQAVHSHILNEHHKRSTMLEEKMRPVEAHVIFMDRLTKLVLGSAAIASAIAAILKLTQ